MAIDLLHPTPEDSMRPNFVPAYRDARRRRAVIVMLDLIKLGGDDAPAKIIKALRQSRRPAGKGPQRR